MTVSVLDLPEVDKPLAESANAALSVPALPNEESAPATEAEPLADDSSAPLTDEVAGVVPKTAPPPVFSSAAPPPEDHEYRVQPFDQLLVEVFNEPDISKVYVVSAAGTINHPLLNAVPIADSTLAQAEHLLTELLKRDFLVNPKVSIRVERSSGRRVTLLGEVKKTGTLYISPDQRFSLLNVIAAAGGFGELAAKTRVRIIRTVDGEERMIKVNCDDLLKGRSESGDVDLMPGDVIMVPEAFF